MKSWLTFTKPIQVIDILLYWDFENSITNERVIAPKWPTTNPKKETLTDLDLNVWKEKIGGTGIQSGNWWEAFVQSPDDIEKAVGELIGEKENDQLLLHFHNSRHLYLKKCTGHKR